MSDQQHLEQTLVQSLEKSYGPLPGTMIELLRAAARDAGDKAAILEPERDSLSYSALLALVEQTVKILNAMGLQRQSRVALALPTSPEAAAVYLSVMMGMTVVGLAPTATAEEYKRLLTHGQVDALIVQATSPTAARDVAVGLNIPVIEITTFSDGPAGLFKIAGVDRVPDGAPQFAQPDDKILVITTSGTTSLPKFVYWTQRSIIVAVYTFLTPFLNTAGPRLNMLPLHHGAGANSILSAVAAKNSYACLRSHDAAHIYQHLALYKPESIYVVPAILRALVAAAPNHQQELASLRIKLVYAGSATVSAPLLNDVQRIFGAAVNIGYGLSEVGPVASLLIASSDSKEYKAGSVGKPCRFATSA